MNNWIDRNDKEAECPCWVWDNHNKVPVAFNVSIGFNDWTYWMPIEMPERPKGSELLTYEAGDKFLVNGEECMLCRVGADAYTLIALDSGNRWFDPPIRSNLFRLTLDRIKTHLYAGDVITPL